MSFTLYFLGYLRDFDEEVPEDPVQRAEYAFSQKAMLELTHNWGTESDANFAYHDGNSDPRGLAILVLQFQMYMQHVNNLRSTV